jgi:DNA-binding protein HU-beta
MNKAGFIELIQKNGNYKTKKEAENALVAFQTSIEEVLLSKEEVSLVGFMKIGTKVQKGKTGKVPGTNKTYTTSDKMAIQVKIGKPLKEKVAALEV